jgi:hypothetical protein
MDTWGGNQSLASVRRYAHAGGVYPESGWSIRTRVDTRMKSAIDCSFAVSASTLNASHFDSLLAEVVADPSFAYCMASSKLHTSSHFKAVQCYPGTSGSPSM